MAAVAGFGGRITLGGTVLRAYHWAVDWKVDEFDASCFENFGMGSYQTGLKDYDISFDAYWDEADNPFAAPLLIAPGGVDSMIIQYRKANTSTQIWSFPTVVFITVHSETGVRDIVRYTVTAKASGTVPNVTNAVAVSGNTPTVPAN